MKNWLVFISCLGILGLIGCDNEEDKKENLERLLGDWKLESVNGGPSEFENYLYFRDNGVYRTLYIEGTDTTRFAGTYVLKGDSLTITIPEIMTSKGTIEFTDDNTIKSVSTRTGTGSEITVAIIKKVTNAPKWETTVKLPGTVNDVNGNVYHTVIIGNQEWTIENFRATNYNDGLPITKITDNALWGSASAGAYCVYNNLESNVATYGNLYNWKAINSGKLAPVSGGWRIPSASDWAKLITFAGGDTVAGLKLKSVSGWRAGLAGTDNYGFKGLPGGYRGYNGTFFAMSENGHWWTTSDQITGTATVYSMDYRNSKVLMGANDKKTGYSIRLVRDR